MRTGIMTVRQQASGSSCPDTLFFGENSLARPAFLSLTVPSTSGISRSTAPTVACRRAAFNSNSYVVLF